MSEFIKNLFITVWGCYIFILSIWIILEKRSPQATIGWLLALIWLPVVGWVIYYLFGPQKLKRHSTVRAQSRYIVAHQRIYLKEQIAKALARYPHLGFDEQRFQDIDYETYATLADKLDQLKSPYHMSADAREISRVIYEGTGLPVTVASDVELLQNGAQAFDSICDAIRGAKHTIHVEYYIYEPDKVGNILRDLLVLKAREGVKVRVLLDWLGSRRINTGYMAELVSAGGEFAFFHEGFLRQIRPLLNMRTHRKIVVCDGAVGFTGGVNITEEEDFRYHKNPYHDLHLRIEGPAVYWLDEVFLEDWYYTTNKIPQDIPAPARLEDVPLEKVRQVQVIASGPDTEQAPIWCAKLMAIHAAKRRVWLATPYFVPDEPALFALKTAALRGVDVRLLLPLVSDSLITTLAARSWYKELLQVGVRIWEYAPNLMHAKAMLVDDVYGFVGTDNFDNRSFRLNFEVTVLSYDYSSAIALAVRLEKDMADAKEIVMADIEMPWWHRLPEDIARLGAPLL